MGREKDIEELSKELHYATNESFISCRKIARILVERCGYGNIEQAVKEFAEELKKKIKTFMVSSDEDELFRFGFETLAEHLPEEIDNLVDKFYGDISCETCSENNNAEYNENNCPNKGNCGGGVKD